MESKDNTAPIAFEFNVDQDLQLDLILERIQDWSEDISDFQEEEYYRNRWLQVLGDNNPDSILHLFFAANEEYLYSLNGDIIFRGKWRILEDSNAFIIEKVVNNQVTKSELFDLAYLSEDFFVLKKHGDQSKKGKAKYLVLGREELIGDMEQEEVLDLLRSEGQSGSNWSRTIFTLAIFLLLILMLLRYYEVV